jgi:hypothetical protein
MWVSGGVYGETSQRQEGIDSTCVSRVVSLTTLAPDIVAAIRDEVLLSMGPSSSRRTTSAT